MATCPQRNDDGIGVLVSPQRVQPGAAMTVIVATLTDEAPIELALTDGHENLPIEAELMQGVPSLLVGRGKAPESGHLHAIVSQNRRVRACVEVELKTRRAASQSHEDIVWPAQREWTRGEEALYSGWVRVLFHATRGDEFAYRALHEVTSQPSRNLLYGYLGLGEDGASGRGGLFLRPDCADVPYFLRAYYAWKRRLPFAFRKCSRGTVTSAPRCVTLEHTLETPKAGADPTLSGELAVVQRYFRRTLAWGVHTGNGRVAHDDDDSDFYPVPLTRGDLRPGVIYADPYGHIFVVAEFMAAQNGDPGVLYAIDGQPDGSITRKRFWEGNFLWNPDPALGGSGFKAFRPVRLDANDPPSIHSLSNAELVEAGGHVADSASLRQLTAAQFYDAMDALITPGRRDPHRAQRETIAALHEAAVVRVTSVNNGEAHFAAGKGTVAMPDGYAIFETTGAWENFATPARDLRLLIAIDLIVGFTDKVRRNAKAMLAPGEVLDEVVAQLNRSRDAMLGDERYAFEYTRSDGSVQRLRLADLVARRTALEIAYNPNDCPEVRWGAPANSPERATCRRRAPADQQRKMATYRSWFHERRRPARGDPGPPLR